MNQPNPLKLDIGSGGRGGGGWLGVDWFAPDADVKAKMDNLPYPSNTVDEIFSSHALEHIPKRDVVPTLREWYRVLRVGGILTLRVPDLEYCCREWLKNPSDTTFPLDRIFGSQEHEGQFHRTGFTDLTIRQYLVDAGFIIDCQRFIDTHTQQTIEVIARKGGVHPMQERLQPDVTPEVGIIIPSWVWGDATRDLELQCLASIKSTHSLKIYLVSNRLHPWTPEDFCQQCRSVTQVPLDFVHEPFKDFGVAGAWNEGIVRAAQDGCRYYLIMAHDCMLSPTCIDELVKFGDNNPDVMIWSAFDTNGRVPTAGAATDGADFTCVMLRPQTIDRLGWFDQLHFPTAYWEDNDYMVRAYLTDTPAKVVHDAKMFHLISATIKLCPHAAKRVRDTFDLNRRSFASKWGTTTPPSSPEEAKATCYSSPWNKGLAVSYCGG